MTYYLLPCTSKNIIYHINCQLQDDTPDIFISHSLSSYISSIKERITPIESAWNKYKKFLNPYEFIHSNIPGKHKSIAKYNPLSRSYFKMMELIQIFDLCKQSSAPINTFHLAEGPGGFIEALCHYRNNPNDRYIGMTIQDSDVNVPGWKKSQKIIKQFPNIHIENGADGSGDILQEENLKYIYKNYAHTMDIVTGDGGFDFSENFNNQEVDIARLLYGQICNALILQKPGGVFVLKMFDCFMHHTCDLLYLLTVFYRKVYICKPHTSRYANSEKYIICKDYQKPKLDVLQLLLPSFQKMNSSDSRIYRFLDIQISSFFINKLQEYNAIFGQQQLENISHTLALISSDEPIRKEKCDLFMKNNTIKCIQWCSRYNIEINIISGLIQLPHQNDNLQLVDTSANTSNSTSNSTTNDSSNNNSTNNSTNYLCTRT